MILYGMTSSQEKAVYMVSNFARHEIPVFRGASSAAQLFTFSPASTALSELIVKSVSYISFFLMHYLIINSIAKDGVLLFNLYTICLAKQANN